MRICQQHWDKLRGALTERGLSHLGAKTAEDAVRNVVTELEGREAENDFDPLMACNNMIFSAAVEKFGLDMLMPDAPETCPICRVLKVTESSWIDGPAEAAFKHAKDKGLV